MRVHLWGELGFYGPGREARFEVTLEHETPILDAVRRVGVPPAEVAVAGLNGEVVRLEDPSLIVTDGDRLDLFPPSSGGSGVPAGGRPARAADGRPAVLPRGGRSSRAAPRSG